MTSTSGVKLRHSCATDTQVSARQDNVAMNTGTSMRWPLRAVSIRFGVPAQWLREGIDSARGSCLRVGNRLLFEIDLLEQRLFTRARTDREGVADRAADRAESVAQAEQGGSR